MCQNLMILARSGDLHSRPDLGAFPPLVLRWSNGLARRRDGVSAARSLGVANSP
jgi:hypothetical protein